MQNGEEKKTKRSHRAPKSTSNQTLNHSKNQSDIPLRKLRVSKYAVKVVSLAISVIIILALAGPMLGFLTLGRSSTSSSNIGFSIDTSAIQSQFNSIFSNISNITQPHTISIPVHNDWIFPADASLVISLEVSGNTVYQTSGTVSLQAFQSGAILMPFQLSQSELTKLQGNQITVGGSLSLGDPSYLWTISIPLTQGGAGGT